MGEPELKAKLGFPTAARPSRLFAWLLGVVQHRMEGSVSYRQISLKNSSEITQPDPPPSGWGGSVPALSAPLSGRAARSGAHPPALPEPRGWGGGGGQSSPHRAAPLPQPSPPPPLSSSPGPAHGEGSAAAADAVSEAAPGSPHTLRVYFF